MAKRRASKKRKKKHAGSFSLGKIFSRKPILIFLLCAITAGGIFYGIRYFFLNSQFFTIKEIVVNKDQGYSFYQGERKLQRLYIGRNIFTIDLKQVQTLVKHDYPQLRKVEVRRNLPEILEVDVISREPAAAIDTAGGIVIDREGVVLAVREGTKGLVKIKGISFFLNAPARGEKISNKSLDKALVLLNGLRRKMRSSEKNIEYINVSNRSNIILGIDGVTVKMGTDDFSRKINMLKEILKDPNMNMKGIAYIDLRFKDAVISPK